MTGKLDWKWIAIGVLIMIALNVVGGLILALVLRPDVHEAGNVEEITLSTGFIVIAAVVNFLSFAIGGFIVGVKSAGRTILEPGISAAIAVLIALMIVGNLTVVNLITGGLVPFIAGMIGGWVGERRQAAA